MSRLEAIHSHCDALVILGNNECFIIPLQDLKRAQIRLDQWAAYGVNAEEDMGGRAQGWVDPRRSMAMMEDRHWPSSTDDRP